MSARQSAIRRSVRRLAHDRTGAAAVEFAFIAPILMVVAVGIAQFGLVLNDYVMLTEAVRDGARQLALSRGGSTPLTTTVNQIYSAAPNLTQSSLTIEITVNGTDCDSDAACQTALNTASGKAAVVNATYPCKLLVMAVDYAPSCTLSSTTAEMIE
jgi:Flp pilus assembly protein TadG